MSLSLRAILLLAAAVPAMPAPAQAADARVEIPIRTVVLPDGVRRYAIRLTIDGQPVEAQLDTGSTGLRVLQTGLTGGVASAGGARVRYSYGSGVQLIGRKVPAEIGLGALPVAAVPIERVETVECTKRKPDCPAATLPAGDFRIGGNGVAGQGFMAIIGTGLRSDTVPNPLVGLGARRWIVDLPRPGETEGKLILNPGTEEVERYRRFAVLGDSNQIVACLVRTDTGKRICGPAMVDTGANGLRVQGGKADEMWPRGTPAAIVLGDAGGAAAFPVTIGRRDQASGMFPYPRRADSDGTTLNLGLAPFFHWSILFDADARRIGVIDRPPP